MADLADVSGDDSLAVSVIPVVKAGVSSEEGSGHEYCAKGYISCCEYSLCFGLAGTDLVR